ncbi:PLP-dependent aminotransferase family protein [Allopusillimonas soli]|uniref:PLP-dependent aminotransferase family protein n=1 Tax=Allopusillimonas soli TaxID=659016 RepID=A0A853F715_9BURK|nr:PLP-dependent aminotransferase family protein [Allopusillimonas soli]NYT35759.1 PLP-dependent aminotransferase family protein [Allopusillimonas soli]TEA76140.1 PLP-dependent aminotransferase family protein [Allopusillimonas soli]
MSSPHLDALAALDQQSTDPLYRQIYDRFRRAISSGVLKPGDRIPSARALAKDLGLARGTVETAYAVLAAEGYVQARGQAGTIVTPGLAIHARSPKHISAAPAPAEQTASSPTALLPFQLGLPALDAFPRKIWARLGARHLRAMHPIDMAYPPLHGLADLRREIAAYLQVSRGIHCMPAQIIITSGYSQTLRLIIQALLHEGDQVWMEDPGYPMTRALLTHARLHIRPVPVDQDGLRVTEGIRSAGHARAAVVTPAHQSPLCVSLSLPRRLALLDWASRENAWIIEDDYDGEYRYASRPLPALKSLDREGRVLYAGTFSKVLYPGIRLAYLVVPENEIERFRHIVQSNPDSAPALHQAIVTSFITEGHFGRHIQRMRKLYGERRTATAAGLSAILGHLARVVPQPGGMHLILQLLPHIDDTVLAQRMRKDGLYAHALSNWAQHVEISPALLLNFTNVASEAMARSLAQRILRLV